MNTELFWSLLSTPEPTLRKQTHFKIPMFYLKQNFTSPLISFFQGVNLPTEILLPCISASVEHFHKSLCAVDGLLLQGSRTANCYLDPSADCKLWYRAQTQVHASAVVQGLDPSVCLSCGTGPRPRCRLQPWCRA